MPSHKGLRTASLLSASVLPSMPRHVLSGHFDIHSQIFISGWWKRRITSVRHASRYSTTVSLHPLLVGMFSCQLRDSGIYNTPSTSWTLNEIRINLIVECAMAYHLRTRHDQTLLSQGFLISTLISSPSCIVIRNCLPSHLLPFMYFTCSTTLTSKYIRNIRLDLIQSERTRDAYGTDELGNRWIAFYCLICLGKLAGARLVYPFAKYVFKR